MKVADNIVLQRRRAGILLHITSLPGGIGQGDFGHDAYRFIEFLAASGVGVWQILPLCPTHNDLSPYLGLSVHAGNPMLISLDWLLDRGLLTREIMTQPAPSTRELRQRCLQSAYQTFRAQPANHLHKAYAKYCASTAWLDDFVFYTLLKKINHNSPWWRWKKEWRDHTGEALSALQETHAQDCAAIRFEQFIFQQQWQELRDYAHRHRVLIFGDMPIFVAHDSAEVWAQRDLFALDSAGKAQSVAGVPPDFFSTTGQRWGNPHYDWAAMQANGFSWWIKRIDTELARVDMLRIDHFRGLQAYWSIPAKAETAIEGEWVEAPGEALLQTLQDRFAQLPLIAEDLGTITAEVTALREKFHLPGMKILQFAFDGNPHNPYLPHHHVYDSVVYTGTHDNDSIMGWFASLDKQTQQYVLFYLQQPVESMPWSFITMALESVAALAIIPLQDILALGPGHRMNTPGTEQHNWRWRFSWEMLAPDLAARFRALIILYDRLN